MKGNTFIARGSQSMFFFLLLILVSLAPVASVPAEDGGATSLNGADTIRDESLRNATSLSLAFRNALENIRPSVVSIHVDQRPAFGKLSAKPILPEPWQRYMEHALGQVDAYLKNQPVSSGPQSAQPHGGTGVIVSREGYVLTSCAVVAEAHHFIVKTHANVEYPAKVARKDTKTGLAVLKIDASDLPAACFADLNETRVGDWVVAIGGAPGNPIAAGIISSIANDHRQDADQRTYIHTDALIGPANQGGPMVNLKGELVGINIFDPNPHREFRNFGVVAPSNLAQRMLDSMIPDRAIATHLQGTIRSWGNEIIDLITQAEKPKRSVDAKTVKFERRDGVSDLASRFQTLVTKLSQGRVRVEVPTVDQPKRKH